MFVEKSDPYRGYNPTFWQRVQERRRDEDRRRKEAAVRVKAESIQARLDRIERERQAYLDRIAAMAAESRQIGYRETVTAMDIIAGIAAEYGFTVSEITGPSRTRDVVMVRQLAMVEVRKRKPALSLPQIGRLFNRDHTTVLYALRKLGEENYRLGDAT
jgi:chromosomal replication initiator protein